MSFDYSSTTLIMTNIYTFILFRELRKTQSTQISDIDQLDSMNDKLRDKETICSDLEKQNDDVR